MHRGDQLALPDQEGSRGVAIGQFTPLSLTLSPAGRGDSDNLPPVARTRLHHRPRDRSVECELKFRVAGPQEHARPRGVLTAKGPASFVGGVKVREETEVEVKDAHATLDLLAELGFRVEFVYNKHRAMWTLDGVVTVTLDTLVFGSFVELEGPLEVLPEQARSLGFDPKKALKDSYSVLARKHLQSTKKQSER